MTPYVENKKVCSSVSFLQEGYIASSHCTLLRRVFCGRRVVGKGDLLPVFPIILSEHSG